MNKKLQDDCFLHDEDRLSHAEALAILRERMAPVVAARHVGILEAAGRILAEKVVAPRNIPAHTNAAVDGYAFAFSDYNADKGKVFPVHGRAAAGHASKSPLPAGAASLIFTGATMPQGADTVVMLEDTESRERDGETLVAIPGGLKQGANCRLAGEDVKAGTALLEPGCRLRPQDIAAAASAGKDKLACFEPLRVAVYSTGDEIVRAGTPLEDGQVYDANAPMLHGLVEATGVECIDMGILPDDADAVRASLQAAAGIYDVVITSGSGCARQFAYVADRREAWAANGVRADRRQRRPRTSRQSRRGVCLLPALCASRSCTAGGRCVANAAALSTQGRLFRAKEKDRTPGILAWLSHHGQRRETRGRQVSP